MRSWNKIRAKGKNLSLLWCQLPFRKVDDYFFWVNGSEPVDLDVPV